MSAISAKASTRIALNRSLLAIIIGVFFLIINLREELLFQKILTIQLILAIPLFITSILSYSKMGYSNEIKKWNILGYITFIFAYAFLLNVIGILLGNIVGVTIALIFFASSWILALTYSFVDISYDKSVIKERIIKDSLFISIQIIFGVLVVLGVI